MINMVRPTEKLGSGELVTLRRIYNIPETHHARYINLNREAGFLHKAEWETGLFHIDKQGDRIYSM